MSKNKKKLIIVGIVLAIWISLITTNLLMCNREFDNAFHEMQTYPSDSICRKEWNDYCVFIESVVAKPLIMMGGLTYFSIIKECPESDSYQSHSRIRNQL